MSHGRDTSIRLVWLTNAPITMEFNKIRFNWQAETFSSKSAPKAEQTTFRLNLRSYRMDFHFWIYLFLLKGSQKGSLFVASSAPRSGGSNNDVMGDVQTEDEKQRWSSWDHLKTTAKSDPNIETSTVWVLFCSRLGSVFKLWCSLKFLQAGLFHIFYILVMKLTWHPCACRSDC